MRKIGCLTLAAACAAMLAGWILKKKRKAGKSARAVTVICGADGPTSIFLAGKFKKRSHMG